MASGINSSALRTARERAGLTQHELARIVGAAGGERVSRWELGTSEPRPVFIRELAHVLHLRPVDLVRFAGDVPDLRALRLCAGLTVLEVVGRSYSSQPAYARWEAGIWTRLPAPATLEALAEVFGDSVAVVIAAFEEARRLRSATRV